MSTTSLAADERETIIRWSDGDATASIWTAQRAVITKLRRNPAAELVEEGVHGSTAWADFRLPARLLTFRSPRAKRQLTDEQRAEVAARLAASRSKTIEATSETDPEDADGYSGTPLGVRR